MHERPATSDKPIFLDETGLRWRLSRIVLLGFATGLLLLPIVLALSILKVGVLPERSGELRQQIITGFPSWNRIRPMTSRGFGRREIRAQ
jgi:hypothetical protein